MGKEKYYEDFFLLFQKEIAAKGMHETINQYLFKGDEIAEEMLKRFFSGKLGVHFDLSFQKEPRF